MPKYEYRYIRPGFTTGERVEGMMESLNDMGEDGWRYAFTWGDYIVMEKEKDSGLPVDNDPEPGIAALPQ